MPVEEIDGYRVPEDFCVPCFENLNKVHEWKNYIIKPLQEEWLNLTEYQKKIIAASAEEMASREQWD